MNQKNIEPFLKGSFQLDCPLIELIPVVASDKRSTLSGSGFISINENGYFDLKVYFPQTFSIDETFEKLNWEAGKVISDEFYYDLVAHDISGKKWHAKRFIPDKNSGPNGSMIIGQIPELSHKQETTIDKDKHHLQLFFNTPLKLPLNTLVKEEETVGTKIRKLKTSIRLARFEAYTIDFEIEQNEGFTVLTAASDEVNFTDILINRIFEALSFVTANSEPWSMMIIRRNMVIENRVQAVKSKSIKSRTPPPISYQNQQKNNSVWRLFARYFEHIVSNDLDHSHHLSTLFYSIMESGKAALDVEALTLSVTIESLLSSELKGLYKISEELEENIKHVKKMCSETKVLDNDFKQRMAGVVSGMKNPRAKDILFVLRNSGLIDSELVKTYGQLRNKSAHGARGSGADIQNFFNQTSAVLVLFYQLIFLIIKYNGEYTDYGTYQYPTKQFIGTLP